MVAGVTRRLCHPLRRHHLSLLRFINEDVAEAVGVLRVKVRQFLHRNYKRIVQLFVSGPAATYRELRVV